MPDEKQPLKSRKPPAKQSDEYPERKFLIGTAISVYQNSGDPNSNWAWYEEDFKLAADVGSNATRISLEWSRIEPRRGEIDKEAIQHYHDMFDCLERNGMEPLVTLHHFVHPRWFDELGGFEKEENIDIFLDWVRVAFGAFGRRIRSWSTFNEPGCFASSGWLSGLFPPGKMFHFKLAGTVLLNLMKAHRRAYYVIKSMPGGQDTRIGIVHNWMRYEQYESKWARWAPWTAGLVWLADHVWGNEVVLKYLMTGYFDWYPLYPFSRVYWRDPNGRPPLDWVGLNYYGRIIVTAYCMPSCYPWELLTDLDQGLHPEGFYRVQQAVADNYDVRGLMYWTLVDNFEWAFGYIPKFGLFEWDHKDPEGKRVERESVKSGTRGKPSLREWFRTLPATIEQQWAINANARKEPLPT